VLEVIPWYTLLVIDTNTLLSSLSIVASLIQSNHWTVIIPLAGKCHSFNWYIIALVICNIFTGVTEPDSLSKNSSPLGNAANIPHNSPLLDDLAILLMALPLNDGHA
jgi:hypothetical protein